MAQLTRRGLIKQTSLSAAAIGALMTMPALTAAHASAALAETDLPADTTSEPLVAYVRDTTKGEVALLVGTREIIVRDRELVKRLVKAAR